MKEPPSKLGWMPWQLITAVRPELAGRPCSVGRCPGDAVAGVKRRMRRAGGYHLYWQPYCRDHAGRLGVDVVGGRLLFVEGFSLPVAR